MTARALGRRPPKNAKALRLSAFLTGQVPPHPVAADHFSQVKTWFLGSNDRYGTCGPTSAANYLKLVYKYLLGEDITVTDDAIFDLYRRSGNPNFDPATDADDNGVDLQTMLEALASGGIQVVRANGTVETVKPVAFAKVDAGNLDEIRAAISIFGGTIFGVDLEVAQQAQSDAHPPVWDYKKSGAWGGHAVMTGLYTSQTSGVDLGDISWKMVVGMTDAFIAHQLGEVWALILPLHLSHPAFQQGVDLAGLASAYQAITDRPLPLPAPSPSPGPAPFPGPTPSPTPSPSPSPGPVVDDADRALVAQVAAWPEARHSGPASRVARALVAWKRAKGL